MASARKPSSFNEAAAYHCGKPRERRVEDLPFDPASMRPQHITAENPARRRGRPRASADGFNEAAAYHCGKPTGRRARGRRGRTRFNEAAAYHCGKPSASRHRSHTITAGTRFNEAAAYHCGKPSDASSRIPDRLRASMRPQHITAENRGGEMANIERVVTYASMRPQHITAENQVGQQADRARSRRLQ